MARKPVKKMARKPGKRQKENPTGCARKSRLSKSKYIEEKRKISSFKFKFKKSKCERNGKVPRRRIHPPFPMKKG